MTQPVALTTYNELYYTTVAAISPRSARDRSQSWTPRHRKQSGRPSLNTRLFNIDWNIDGMEHWDGGPFGGNVGLERPVKVPFRIITDYSIASQYAPEAIIIDDHQQLWDVLQALSGRADTGQYQVTSNGIRRLTDASQDVFQVSHEFVLLCVYPVYT